MPYDQKVDIQAERAYSVEKGLQTTLLTETFQGGKEVWARKQEIARIVEQEPVFARQDRYFLGRTERFQRALAISRKFVELRAKHKLNPDEVVIMKNYIDEYFPVHLHESMFLPVLIGQGSDEQHKKWLDDALNYRMLGCYAQTELGHGSNLSGLETTATLDKTTDEWIVNTPHASSGKYWIGSLGCVANVAAVQAKLIIDGKDYGTHPFLVPIRDKETHQTLPGVEIMDIGPKVGANAMDNGYMLLKQVRIPRTNMLMRYARVSREGVYSKPIHNKLAYGAMTLVRVRIVENAANALSRAVTIGTRYCAVRRQGGGQGASGELAVLDYPSVQYRIFTMMAAAYARSLTGRAMMASYNALMEDLRKGDTSKLADVHAYSSGLKSFTSTLAADGIEDIRKCLGGHGYSMFSGIPDYYRTYLPSNTYEGENWLLTQQTARYLLKMYNDAIRSSDPASQLSETTQYLLQLVNPSQFAHQRCSAQSMQDLLNPTVQLTILGHRAASLVAELAQLKTDNVSWSELNIDTYRVSRAHCQFIIAFNFINYLDDKEMRHAFNNVTAQVLKQLCDLFVLFMIEKDLGDHLETGYLTSTHAKWVRQGVKSLLKLIRPHAVSLVDAFGWPDFLLNSALGSYDGDAYKRLISWAKTEPLNQQGIGRDAVGVVQGYHEYIRPILKGELGQYTSKL
ncbi:hypothetical protein BZG36_00152 [Bifiguratus adelaidae]|uniref:Acyl-coenzyme A oxidase n=1 Tax=Bifiguratus adelaidae TaxID=1938954 RepID=A0A261Y8I6_9FUNG|nr:hypothetical protein BZG36_00152 [Bifiguratus adelaidae]